MFMSIYVLLLYSPFEPISLSRHAPEVDTVGQCVGGPAMATLPLSISRNHSKQWFVQLHYTMWKVVASHEFLFKDCP